MDFLLDFILHIDQYLLRIVQEYHLWTYAILFAVIFCETGLVVTPFLPGDSLLFVAGAIAAQPGTSVNAHLLAAILFARRPSRATPAITRSADSSAENSSPTQTPGFSNGAIWTRRTHFTGNTAARPSSSPASSPIVRTFAPFVAGMGRMHYTRFMAFNLLGGAAWIALFCYAGYLFGDLPFVQQNLRLLIVAIVFVSLLPAVAEVVRSRRRTRNA